MSSIGSHAQATPREGAAQAGGGALVCAVIVGLFVLAAALAATRKDITQGFDEVAHTSYVAHLQQTGAAWPVFEQMRMLDPKTFRFTDEPNYLIHQPAFYALLAWLGPTLEGDPGALLAHRLLNIILAALGLAATLALGLAARLPRHELYAYVIPLACIPVLAPLAGSVNSDNLAFAGGALATLGAWQRVATGRSAWLGLALAGMIAAAWAKLTGMLLTGGLVVSLLAYLAWRGQARRSWLAVAVVAFLIAAAPYLVVMAQYGSPAPTTPAQIAIIEDGARAAGWNGLEHKSFPAYAANFVGAFVVNYMPTPAQRSVVNYAMLAIPVAMLVCAFAGFVLSLRRLARRREAAIDVIVTAGALAIAATLTLHIVYSYARIPATGWLMDAYPRYYLPLAAVIPLACLSLLAAIENTRMRQLLVGFLVVGPIVFRLLGAPLE
jgi:hypothetical protein